MLFSHSADSHVSSYYDHTIVGHESHETKHSGLKILLMAAQIQEGEYLPAVSRNVGPRLVLASRCTFQLHLFPRLVEAHYLLTNTRCPTILRLVREVKDFHPC